MLSILSRRSILSPRLALPFSTSSLRQGLLKSSNLKFSRGNVANTSRALVINRYSTSNTQPSDPNSSADANENPATLNDITPEMWLSLLEKTSSAPWLTEIPSDPEDRLRRSFTLLLQILLYLGRPQDPDAASQFLLAFESAPVSSTSEIGRARRSTAVILRTVVRDILSIPESSPLRGQHSDLFGTHGALVPLSDMYLGDADGEVEEWREFWPRAQPVVLELVEILTNAGYGLDFEKLANEKQD